MTCRQTITPSSSIAPRMLRTLIVPDFPSPKTKSELKETRNDSLFFRATVSYHLCNWCPPWLGRIQHPRHFQLSLWLWLWLICLWCNTLTLSTGLSRVGRGTTARVLLGEAGMYAELNCIRNR